MDIRTDLRQVDLSFHLKKDNFMLEIWYLDLRPNLRQGNLGLQFRKVDIVLRLRLQLILIVDFQIV